VELLEVLKAMQTRYGVAHTFTRTTAPGEILYEDDYQVASI